MAKCNQAACGLHVYSHVLFPFSFLLAIVCTVRTFSTCHVVLLLLNLVYNTYISMSHLVAMIYYTNV